jgi:iron-sulfur cluster insertion protein
MDGPTLEMTPAATEKLIALRGDDPTRSYVRVYVAGQTCCSYRYGLAFAEQPETTDAVSDFGGVRVAIDPESQEACAGAKIDYVETPAGAGFTVLGPAKEGGCACGRNALS